MTSAITQAVKIPSKWSLWQPFDKCRHSALNDLSLQRYNRLLPYLLQLSINISTNDHIVLLSKVAHLNVFYLQNKHLHTQYTQKYNCCGVCKYWFFKNKTHVLIARNVRRYGSRRIIFVWKARFPCITLHSVTASIPTLPQ